MSSKCNMLHFDIFPLMRDYIKQVAFPFTVDSVVICKIHSEIISSHTTETDEPTFNVTYIICICLKIEGFKYIMKY